MIDCYIMFGLTVAVAIYMMVCSAMAAGEMIFINHIKPTPADKLKERLDDSKEGK